MVTLEYVEKAAELVEGAGLAQAEAEHWFYRMPFAGVKYFAYEDAPDPEPREKDPALSMPEAAIR